jgi:hypothetical protein
VASVRSHIAVRHTGSFVPKGTRYTLWRHYEDLYAAREIYAHVDGRQSSVHRNATLEHFLVPVTRLGATPAAWFAPLPFAEPWAGDAYPIHALQTGSRTFAIPPEVAEAIGLPERPLLDLGKAGWGEGSLELRLEVKGAGTPFSRTRLRRPSRASLVGLLPSGVSARWIDAFERDPDPLFVSLKAYEGRPLGGQDARLAAHALKMSEELVGRSPIKVAPTLAYVTCPPEYGEWLASTTRALDLEAGDEREFTGGLATEIRLTPGHVRAAYFDTASERSLVELCGFVSPSADVLEETYNRMVEDAGRYLDELCEKTDYCSELDCFTWPKFGDVHVVFRRDRHGYPAFADEYKFAKSAAWYIAKDQVIVGGVGLVYVDLESVAEAFPSVNEEELEWHHDLYVLNVLRDHVRVLGAFDHARRLAVGETTGLVDWDNGRALERALDALVAASGTSRHYRLEVAPRGLTVDLQYNLLGTTSRHFYARRLLGAELSLGSADSS